MEVNLHNTVRQMGGANIHARVIQRNLEYSEYGEKSLDIFTNIFVFLLLNVS